MILLPPSATYGYCTRNDDIITLCAAQHDTLISVGPTLLKFTDRLPGKALYNSHHGLVVGHAFQSLGMVHGGTRTRNLRAGDPAVSSLTL